MKYNSDYIDKKKEIFASRLQELREESGLSKKDVSEGADIHLNTLGNYENGERLPNTIELMKIANYYNVSYQYLLGESDVRRSDLNFIEINKLTGLSEDAIKMLMRPGKTNRDRIETLNHIIENEDEYQFIITLGLYLTSRVDDAKEIKEILKGAVELNKKEKLMYANSLTALCDMLKCSLDRILFKMEEDVYNEYKKEES